MEEALSQLEQVAAGEDAEAIKNAVGDLEKTCDFYVERRMNRSIRTAVAGHKVEEFE